MKKNYKIQCKYKTIKAWIVFWWIRYCCNLAALLTSRCMHFSDVTCPWARSCEFFVTFATKVPTSSTIWDCRMHADFVAGERVPVSKTFPAHITMVEFDFFIFNCACLHMVLEHVLGTGNVFITVRTLEFCCCAMMFQHVFCHCIWIVRHEAATMFPACTLLSTTLTVVQAQMFGPVVPPHNPLVLRFKGAMSLGASRTWFQQAPTPVVIVRMLIFCMYMEGISINCLISANTLILL